MSWPSMKIRAKKRRSKKMMKMRMSQPKNLKKRKND